MKSTFPRLLEVAALALGVFFAGPQALAAVVTLTPSLVTTTVGTPVIVDVQVSDLGAGNALGAFDLDISFDPALLSFSGVAFGLSLGDPALFEALTSISTATPGVLDFAEVSLLSPAELAAAQGGSFSIAMLTFNGIGSGSTSFAVLDTSTLSDAFGTALPISQATPTPLPEPKTILLLGFGLAALVLVRAKGRLTAAVATSARSRPRTASRTSAAELNPMPRPPGPAKVRLQGAWLLDRIRH